MKLKKLLKEVPLDLFRGNKEIEITGLTSHSKKVAPGNLFVAKKGATDDGSKYIEEAILSGASAVLSDMGNPFLKGVTQLIHPNVCEVEGKIAAAFYNHPSKDLLTIGVTGTNGKTTTTYIIKYLLDALQIPCGLMGTIEYIRGNNHSPADRTTLDVITNHKFLREMALVGCKAVAMEVTSHALVQGRVNEIHFNIALFTNLTHDHLDYHETMENYAAAKALLFERLDANSIAILNGEDPWSPWMVKNCKAKIMTFGFSKSHTLFADEITLSSKGIKFFANFEGKRVAFSSTLIGRHNVMNLLSAIAVLLCQGVPLEALVTHIHHFQGVRGRLERVGHSNVFVDYAHSPDALEKVLFTLREFKKGKIITCFGCGGDRDRAKRPLMAKVVEQLSDIAIVTSDNPRSENPQAIIQEILSGFKNKNYVVEIDRAHAIEKALSIAKDEDIVLIAGKGHETVQVFASQTLPFDDREIALKFLRSHE